MVHQKFMDDDSKERFVELLALKESKGRWYLLAKEQFGSMIKTFGLDRIIDFTITSNRFDYPENLDLLW